MAVTVTQVDNRANVANPFVAQITQDSVRNVTDVVYFLTKANGAANGTIQADYTNTPDGSLTIRDTVFTLPTGASIATYYGDERTNPVFLANPSFVPANPGYAITQYYYTSPGVISQVVAYTSANGKGQVFTGV